jgi:hypothetical protein
MHASNVERTGIRDLKFSEMHRKLGKELKMTDLDVVEVSRINYKPLAIEEAKHGLDTPLEDWQRMAIVSLANPRKYELPAYYTTYNEDLTEYIVRPLNKSAVSRLHNIFSHKKDKDNYYILPDGSVRMNIRCYMVLKMALHGRPTVEQTEEDKKYIKDHSKNVNQEVPEVVDAQALISTFKGGLV